MFETCKVEVPLCSTPPSLWSALLIAAGCPIVLLFGATAQRVLYLCDRLAVLRFCHRPPEYNHAIGGTLVKYAKAAFYLHVLFAILMLGNRAAFPSTDLLAGWDVPTTDELPDMGGLFGWMLFLTKRLFTTGALPYTLLFFYLLGHVAVEIGHHLGGHGFAAFWEHQVRQRVCLRRRKKSSKGKKAKKKAKGAAAGARSGGRGGNTTTNRVSPVDHVAGDGPNNDVIDIVTGEGVEDDRSSNTTSSESDVDEDSAAAKTTWREAQEHWRAHGETPSYDMADNEQYSAMAAANVDLAHFSETGVLVSIEHDHHHHR